eukprot:12404638-Ditylum_brightwellii.AAC.1
MSQLQLTDLWLRREDTLQQFSTWKIGNCVSRVLATFTKYTTTPLSCKQQLFSDNRAAVTHTNYTIAPGIKAHIAAE